MDRRQGARWPWLPSRPDRALRCLRCTNVLVGQHTVLDCSTGAPVAFPALLCFTSASHGTNDECTIDLGFPLVGTMVTSAESFQTSFTIELWVIVYPASIHSFLESRPAAILVGSFPRWYVGLARVSLTDRHICLISRTSLWYPRMERTISWILK